MFDGISKRFDAIFKNLRGLGKITDKNIEKTSREIRKALLEADVNFHVAKDKVQKKLRKNPRGVGMKKEEEKAVWKKLVYPIWRVL